MASYSYALTISIVPCYITARELPRARATRRSVGRSVLTPRRAGIVLHVGFEHVTLSVSVFDILGHIEGVVVKSV